MLDGFVQPVLLHRAELSSFAIQASYSFLGTEIVALAAGEAQNPRRNVPKAIKRVFWRIAFFYVSFRLASSVPFQLTDFVGNNSGHRYYVHDFDRLT
jgi:amino acid permease